MRKLFTIILGIFALTCLTLFATRTMYVKHKTEGVIPFEIAAKDSLYFWNTVADKDADELGLMMYVQTANNGLKAIPYKQVDSIYFGKTETSIDDEKDYIEDGALIKAAFKVSDTKSVYFSQGNLQFNAQGTHKTAEGTAKGTWRFAGKQWDVVGKDGNKAISEKYYGWIDLFGWGTSGWNSGANAYQPWSTSETESDYYPDGLDSVNLNREYAYADWGVYNAISNGGDEPNKWRTLKTEEWQYLFQNNDWTFGYIKTSDQDSVMCFMLIPESFTAPKGITVTKDLNYSYTVAFDVPIPSTNTYTVEQFEKLERLGVVALPSGGYRRGTSVIYFNGAEGGYWSVSSNGSKGAFEFLIAPSWDEGATIYADNSHNRVGGLSVRLVQDLPYYKEDGALVKAAYKVSDSRSVYFSQGNLEFNAVEGSHDVYEGISKVKGTWRFASEQWSTRDNEENESISEDYDGWIGLFGWGTSGWNSCGDAYQPWDTTRISLSYQPGNYEGNNLTCSNAKADWGVYNAISNGGNKPNQWRTLTAIEWDYLKKHNKWTWGNVKMSSYGNTYKCFMLLPEDFVAPDGINITISHLGDSDTTAVDSFNYSVPESNNYWDDSEYADWGVYNAISNGGNVPGMWRTLTGPEWVYLLKNNSWVLGEVEGETCVMLIPENFSAPEGIIVSDEKSSVNGNIYTADQFKKIEKLGVVALPWGEYWSSSVKESTYPSQDKHNTKHVYEAIIYSINHKVCEYVYLYNTNFCRLVQNVP